MPDYGTARCDFPGCSARQLYAHAGVAAADEGDPLFDSEIHVELLVVEYVMAQCWRSYR